MVVGKERAHLPVGIWRKSLFGPAKSMNGLVCLGQIVCTLKTTVVATL